MDKGKGVGQGGEEHIGCPTGGRDATRNPAHSGVCMQVCRGVRQKWTLPCSAPDLSSHPPPPQKSVIQIQGTQGSESKTPLGDCLIG